MTTTNGYDVIYHYEKNGISSAQHDHIQVAAATSDYNTLTTAIKNATQYHAGQGTIVIDSVKSIGGGPLQQ